MLVPGLVEDWKQSSVRGGARTALTLAKAHYPELDLDLITSGIPESSKDGALVDEAAIWQSVLGYDQLCALGMQLNVYYEAYDLPGSPSQASASVSAAAEGADGGDDTTSAAPLTRVNSTNVLDEGLRIGEIGRRMNSKVRLVEISVYRK
jgi:hypothetical protein